jgi:orotate phosphoribosyltransferase
VATPRRYGLQSPRQENITMHRLLNVATPNVIRYIEPSEFRKKNDVLRQNEFEHLLRVLNAYWRRPNRPDAPHVRLSSGKHSNLFLNLAIPFTYPNLRHILAWAMIHLMRQYDQLPIHWVVSSDHAGAAIMFTISDLLGARCDFCEKGVEFEEGTGKNMKKSQDWKRHQIKTEERVLIVEELTTTTGTIEQMLEGIKAGNNTPISLVPFIPVIVDRTGQADLSVQGIPVRGVYTYSDARSWNEDDCELCRQGSRLIDKPRLHWAELMADCA